MERHEALALEELVVSFLQEGAMLIALVIENFNGFI